MTTPGPDMTRDLLNGSDRILQVYSWHLDNLLGSDLSFLRDGALRHPPLVFSCCVFLVFTLPCFLAFLGPWTWKKDRARTRSALRTLLTVVVPTCSLWSSRYIKLTRVLRSHVNILLEEIIKDTVDGVVEFRSPVNDLADLIGSGVIADDHTHTIRIKTGWTWWINYFKWWMLRDTYYLQDIRATLWTLVGQSKSGPWRHASGPSGWLNNNVPTANSNPLGVSLSPFALASSTYPLLCLDHLPSGIISSLIPGSKVTLEFTAFSPSIRMLGAAQVISSVPFILPGLRRRPRSLVSVLKQLNASNGSLIVDSVLNVSVKYEHALRRVHKSLSVEQRNREMWVKTLGVKTWRRDAFLVALEAALVRRGWIERWAIQVTVN